MFSTTWLLIAIGIFAGTYVVRALPFWTSGTRTVSPQFKRFLEIVPAAALGALIAPDAFGTLPGTLTIAILALAAILTIRGVNLTVVVLIAILLTWGILTAIA